MIGIVQKLELYGIDKNWIGKQVGNVDSLLKGGQKGASWFLRNPMTTVGLVWPNAHIVQRRIEWFA